MKSTKERILEEGCAIYSLPPNDQEVLAHFFRTLIKVLSIAPGRKWVEYVWGYGSLDDRDLIGLRFGED